VPGNRAHAVHWTRVDGDVVVEDVRDFGLLGIRELACEHFARDVPGCLAPVPAELWADHRHEPLQSGQLDPVPRAGDSRAFALGATRRILALPGRQARGTLYGGQPPTLRFPAERIVAQLHNLPVDDPVEDFVLDLGRLLLAVQKTAPTSPAV
jgi:hypothetical protein